VVAWLLGLLSVAVVARFVVPRMVRNLFLIPFRAKGAVLKGASARAHTVSQATVAAAEESEPRRHYLVDVTITPSNTDGPFGMWEPGELRLVRPESVLHPESDEPEVDDSSCEVTKLGIEDEGKWGKDEGMKYAGAQRLRLNVAVHSAVKELKFRYYFEEFGNVKVA